MPKKRLNLRRLVLPLAIYSWFLRTSATAVVSDSVEPYESPIVPMPCGHRAF